MTTTPEQTQLILDLTQLIDDRIALALEEALSEPSDNGYLNAESAASYLDCPVSRIHDAVGGGALRHEKDGRRLLFKTEWLDEYVRNGGWKAPNPRKRSVA
jgi:excisionase family DNA binding protein